MSMLPKGAEPCRCGPDQAELPVNLYPSSFNLLHHRPPNEPTLSYLPSNEVGYYRFLSIPTCYSVWNLAYTKSSHWQWFSLLGEGDVSANAGGTGRFLIGWNREDRCGKWSRGNIHQLPLSSIFLFLFFSLPPSLFSPLLPFLPSFILHTQHLSSFGKITP